MYPRSEAAFQNKNLVKPTATIAGGISQLRFLQYSTPVSPKYIHQLFFLQFKYF